jgi:decaprenylphospho-beta-D-ribofuranose 2-oxidase
MVRRIPGRRGQIAAALAVVLLALAIYASTFAISYGDLLRADDPSLRTDVARIAPARVERVDDIREIEQLRAALREARGRGLKVSISGSRHSQGGHTYTAGGVVLNMRRFNRIRAIDSATQTVTVESGATWDEV